MRFDVFAPHLQPITVLRAERASPCYASLRPPPRGGSWPLRAMMTERHRDGEHRCALRARSLPAFGPNRTGNSRKKFGACDEVRTRTETVGNRVPLPIGLHTGYLLENTRSKRRFREKIDIVRHFFQLGRRRKASCNPATRRAWGCKGQGESAGWCGRRERSDRATAPLIVLAPRRGRSPKPFHSVLS